MYENSSVILKQLFIILFSFWEEKFPMERQEGFHYKTKQNQLYWSVIYS